MGRQVSSSPKTRDCVHLVLVAIPDGSLDRGCPGTGVIKEPGNATGGLAQHHLRQRALADLAGTVDDHDTGGSRCAWPLVAWTDSPIRVVDIFDLL